MNEYLLSVDSTAPLTKEQEETYEIISTPLTYTLDGAEKKDIFESETETETFYDKLRNGVRAKSAQVSPQAFLDKWRPLIEKGRKILHLSLSSNVSGSYASACLAGDVLMKEYPETIKVVDTKTGGFCTTKMAMEASELQRKNWPIDKIISWIKKESEKFNLIFTVDDIGHLYRGGRIGHIKAIIGSVLKLKPILYVSNEGKLEQSHNARGVKNAINDVVEKVKRNASFETTWAHIAHGGDEKLAVMLKEKLSEALSFVKHIDIGILSPVLGLHAGPGALVVTFKGKPRDLILDASSIKTA